MSVALINIRQHAIDCFSYSDLMCVMAKLHLAVRGAALWVETTDISGNGGPVEKQEGQRERRTYANWEG